MSAVAILSEPGSGPIDTADIVVSTVVPAGLVEVLARRAAEIALDSLGDSTRPSPYATTEEAAGYLRCSRQRIYDLVSSRRLRAMKDGRRSLFRYEDLDGLLEEGR